MSGALPLRWLVAVVGVVGRLVGWFGVLPALSVSSPLLGSGCTNVNFSSFFLVPPPESVILTAGCRWLRAIDCWRHTNGSYFPQLHAGRSRGRRRDTGALRELPAAPDRAVDGLLVRLQARRGALARTPGGRAHLGTHMVGWRHVRPSGGAALGRGAAAGCRGAFQSPCPVGGADGGVGYDHRRGGPGWERVHVGSRRYGRPAAIVALHRRH
jgi:hypothetical protein